MTRDRQAGSITGVVTGTDGAADIGTATKTGIPLSGVKTLNLTY
ncbi:hypothetical protein Ait01nite_096690 [Actinoplanes italicus]|uniref:Uncharacterized protein n=1 Tax=Actinoplanes italicus TaxID=113567 RepID=A0A2T0KB98_9ACTN|nr:hypothetical protein CLV67_108238 [Actinoplanes italicus]GIE36624.1 hypothetical protein Ait01nite_096690 [Actinoplanes italicus]